MNKRIIIGGVLILLVTGFFLQGCGRTFWLSALETDITPVNPNKFRNGLYIGEYGTDVRARVKVKVIGNEIKDIKIVEHVTLLGGRAEKITGRVIEKQSLEVDTFTGATLSSVVILKAIENALQKATFAYPHLKR